MLKGEYSLSMTVALAEQIKRLLPDFLQYYSTIETETMLENAQHAFRSFWTTKILDKSAKDLDELDDMHPMIRLFDSAGKRRYEYKTQEELLSSEDIQSRAAEAAVRLAGLRSNLPTSWAVTGSP